MVNQLRFSVPAYIDLLADGTDRELDKAAREISTQWNRLEQGISELENSTIQLIQLTEAINEAEAKDVAEEPKVLIERTNKGLPRF